MLASTNASGLALDFLMADYERQEATRKDMIRENYEMSSAKSDLNVNAYKDRAQNRVNGQQNYISPGSSYSTGMKVLYAGDSGVDMDTARAAGVRSVGYLVVPRGTRSWDPPAIR